jgi:hypothetical protein
MHLDAIPTLNLTNYSATRRESGVLLVSECLKNHFCNFTS